MRELVAALVSLALVQIALLATIPGSVTAKLVAAALALVACNVAIARVGARWRLLLLSAIAGLIVVNVVVHLVQARPWATPRLAYVGLLAAYLALALAVLIVRVTGTRPVLAAATAVFMGAAVVAAESVVDTIGVTPAVRWVGGAVPHDTLGDAYPPNSVARTVYPTNPRGYFDRNGPTPWRLESHHEGSRGTLLVPKDLPGTLRVEISSAEILTPWHLQLNEAGLVVTAGEGYVLTFRARADAPRPLSYGISMAHEPWQGLGFYRDATVGPLWQDFSDSFTLPASDPNARLHFDLGAGLAPVEVERVVLRRAASGDAIVPPSSGTEYSVSYRFNALGCRGADYPVPRPSDRRRVLVLGDSSALGEGVHESDTIAARLERSLSAANTGAAPVDVINCGVDGYATRQQRLFYDLVGHRYEPDVVLLLMTADDDMSRREAIERGYDHEPDAIDALLHSVAWLRKTLRTRGRAFDYSQSMQELAALGEACRARNIRLVVGIFRNVPLTPPWTGLRDAVSAQLQGDEVPWIDLGEALLKDHPVESLRVDANDPHPNELAHQLAAEAIEGLLYSRSSIAN